jgi:hypothetical protein
VPKWRPARSSNTALPVITLVGSQQCGQLGDVARYASSFIKREVAPETASEGDDKFKSGHALMAFIYETEGEETLLKCLETWGFPRERCENYAKEYRKRNLMKLAEIMDNQAAKVAYSWDDVGNYQTSANSDFDYWRDGELRRHMMQLLSDQPGAYQAWLATRKRS